MGFQPGSTYVFEYTTANSSGALADTDATPTATATRNGTAAPTFALTVTKVSTGHYAVTGTIPEAWSPGDVVIVSTQLTMGGISGEAVLDRILLEAAPLTVAAIATATAVATVAAIDTVGLDGDTIAAIAAAVNTISLDGGAVAASPAPTTTTFGATGSGLNGQSGAYTGMYLRFTSGALAGVVRQVQTHSYAAGSHSFTLAAVVPVPPSSGDTFDLL